MKVLIVEDDKPTAEFIARRLTDNGHAAEFAYDGATGLQMAQTQSYDVLVIDRLLPGKLGLDLIADLRARGADTPILILTALDAVDERVSGFKAGADDYLTKPFAFPELLVRLEALTRRPALRPPATDLIRLADLEVDLPRRRVMRAGLRIDLTPQEFKLLVFLLQRQGETVTRILLLEEVWGLRFDPRTNVVEAHMSRLRAKIDRGFDVELIRTQHGVGYVIDAPV